MKNLLGMLARATDTKGYPDDKDPAHWRTIHHAKVHIDADGYIDGGGGERLKGKKLTSETWPHRPETYSKPKGADDLRKAWATVAKERMDVHRAKTEKSRKAHEDKLAEAYKAYTDLRAEIEARDPAEAAKFKPRTGGAAASPKGALASLVEATAPEMSAEAKGFEDHGIAAIKAYAEFKKTGSPEALQKAQDALTKATEQMDAIADSEEAKQARAAIIEECKKAGLKSDKLRDLFKEIKNAKASTPTPAPATTPLAGMAEATTPEFPRTPEEVSAMRAKTPLLREFEATRKAAEPALYKHGKFTAKEKKEFEEGMKAIFESSAYGMHIDAATMHLVFDTWFKSQPEILHDPTITKKGGGAVGDSALRDRAKIWTHLLGRKDSIDKDDPKTREKYGFLCSGDPTEYDSTASWYGNCLVRFKKDRLKGRVTYTCADSLSFPDGTYYRGAPRTVAGDADNPSIAGVDSRYIDKTELLRAVRERSLSILGRWTYVELQYFGDLTVDDIESFTFGCTKERADKKLIKKLKAKGIKVYCRESSSRGGKCIEI